MNESQIDLQRKYYANTASAYDALHLDAKDEHYFALSFLIAAFDFLEIESILDIGAGTGRALLYVKQHRPNIRVLGVEPVEELREQGYSKGLSADELVDGDANRLSFASGEFDLVSEFGVLHHVPQPDKVVAEMLRVAKKGVFISDSNNFGQGSFVARTIKQLINAMGLWKVANFFKTRGRGYTISEEDGLAYSYSVFNNYAQVKSACRSVHLLNTQDANPDLYRTAAHVALLGIK